MAEQPKRNNRSDQCGVVFVVAPTRRETGGTRSSTRYRVATVGIGQESAGILTSLLETPGANAILSLGFAGALSPGLKAGALTLHRSVTTTEGGTRTIACDSSLLEVARSALKANKRPFHEGSLLTTPRPLLTPKEKHAHREMAEAVAVDMEGYWLAQAAAKAGVPLLALRAVIDEVDLRLPQVVDAIMADGGHDEWRHVMRAIRAPGTALGLASLAVRSWLAGKSLRHAARVLLPEMLKTMESRRT